MKNIEETVKTIIADQADLPVDKIKLTDSLNFLSLDSLDSVEILIDIESAFDISIPDKEFKKIKTVGDVVTLVANRLSGNYEISSASAEYLFSTVKDK